MLKTLFTKKRIKRLCLGLIALWLFGFVLYCANILLIQPQKTQQTTDAIVVLTGGKGRIGKGLALFAAGKANHLFVSGVHNEYTPARIRALWHGKTALPACCVFVGKEATTTLQNAQETKDWAAQHNIQSIRLVTSNYHMSRALLEFKAALPGVTFIKHSIVQDNFGWGDLYFWQLLVSEYHKYLLRSVQLVV